MSVGSDPLINLERAGLPENVAAAENAAHGTWKGGIAHDRAAHLSLPSTSIPQGTSQRMNFLARWLEAHLVQKELVDDALFDHDAVLQREHEMRHVRRRQQRPPSRLQRCDPQRRQRVVVAARLRKSVRRRIEEVEVAEAMRLVRLFVLNPARSQ